MKFIKVKIKDDDKEIIINISHIIYFHKCQAYRDCTEIHITKDREYIICDMYIEDFIEKLKSLL